MISCWRYTDFFYFFFYHFLFIWRFSFFYVLTTHKLTKKQCFRTGGLSDADTPLDVLQRQRREGDSAKYEFFRGAKWDNIRRVYLLTDPGSHWKIINISIRKGCWIKDSITQKPWRWRLRNGTALKTSWSCWKKANFPGGSSIWHYLGFPESYHQIRSI